MSDGKIIRGAILAGGLSRRFGSDKALARVGEIPLLLNLLQTLGDVVFEPAVIVNAPERYADFSCPRLVDLMPGRGPLNGIYTALAGLRADAVLVLTCDMPCVTRRLLRTLVAAYRPGDTAVLADAGRGAEHFPGIYSVRIMPFLEKRLLNRELSVRDLIRNVTGVRTITVRNFQDEFFNMNTPEDYSAIRGGRYANAGTDGIDHNIFNSGLALRRPQAS